MRVLVLLALAACTDLPKGDDVACASGEIRVLSTGALHATLADALASVDDVDTICVGEGTWDLADSLDCENPYPADDFRELTIQGAGSDRTRFVGHAGDDRAVGCHDLRVAFWEATDRVAIQGVTFEDAVVDLGAGVVAARDVRVEGYTGPYSPALSLTGSASLTVDGLTVAENTPAGGGGFVLMGAGTVRDLVVADNAFANGYFGTLHGTLTVDGLTVTDNVRTTTDPGFDLLELYGVVDLADVTFSGNRTNGAMLSGWGTLSARGITFEDNVGSWRSVAGVHTDGSQLTLTDARFVGNVGADAAVGVYDDARLVLIDATFVGNAPCDVAANGCVTGLGEGVSLTCDSMGCR